mgnify:CR=1 FL=1
MAKKSVIAREAKLLKRITSRMIKATLPAPALTMLMPSTADVQTLASGAQAKLAPWCWCPTSC